MMLGVYRSFSRCYAKKEVMRDSLGLKTIQILSREGIIPRINYQSVNELLYILKEGRGLRKNLN